VLVERHGLPAVIDYFKRFASSDDRVANFGPRSERISRALKPR